MDALTRESAEYFLRDNAVGHLRDRAGHANRKIVADFDGNDAAGHVDGNLAVAQAEPVRHRRRRAAAAAARQRVTRAAFPDFDLDIIPVEHLHQLHVDAIRKAQVRFQQRPQLPGQVGADFRQRQHTMRIANRRRAKVELLSAQVNRFVDDFAARAGHGNFVAPETDPAHLDAHDFTAVHDRGLHEAAGRFEHEFVLADQFPVPQKANPIGAFSTSLPLGLKCKCKLCTSKARIHKDASNQMS